MSINMFDRSKNPNKESFFKIKLLLVGMIAGFVSGFFGAGGGIVLILSAGLIMKNDGTKDIMARTAVMTALFSSVSAISYVKEGNLPIMTAVLLSAPAFLGGLCGALLLDKLPSRTIRIIFGFISAVGGMIMLAE